MEKCRVISCASAPYSHNGIIYFRKRFIAKKNADFKINIFADARYKLYLNGVFVGAGPSKGNDKELFYDELSIGQYLIDGENEIEVDVLYLACTGQAGRHRYVTSLRRSGVGVLEIGGTLDGESFVTDNTWDCAMEHGIEFIVPEYAFYTGLPEHVTDAYNRKQWEKATVAADRDKLMFYGEPSAWYSYKSPIPPQRIEKKDLPLRRGTTDFGYLTTAYLEIAFKGRGRVKLTYAERYTKQGGDDREDKTGELLGDYDIVEVDGETVFKPYWFRCFRFIRAEIEGDVKIGASYAYETGYPLDVSGDYDFSNEADNKLWEISERTLRRCMHDTFFDCPYYEQLQYAMDTYLQCIFAYQISGDDRLQRKAIRDFAMSANGEGLTQSRTPSAQPQYIPGFALFYIMMTLYHFNRYGDKELFVQNMPQIISVFLWYKRHSTGDCLVKKSIYWHFIDWSEDFTNSPSGRGVPPTEEGCSLGIESLMLCYVLKQTASAVKGTAYESLAEEYEEWAQRISLSAERLCYSEEKGLYADAEDKKYFSQHMQIWAVLSGCAKGERAKRIMEKSFELTGAQATFAYAYLLFRALEKAGVYELRKDMLNKLRRLVDFHCTTVPETPKDSRSECHAWGAVVLYEFTAMDLGVKQINGKIVIKPYVKDRESAKGTVYTAKGAVYVSWKKKNGKVYIYCDKPEAEIIAPDGCETVVCSSEAEVLAGAPCR